MDPLSHAVLGAAAAQSTALTSRMRAVAVAAAVGSLAPDLDVLIRSSGDPVLTLEYHRQFTHALLFVPVGALACAALVFYFVRANLTFAQTYLACLTGYLCHPFLDAFTTYGTELFWPFSGVRVAWNTIAVADFAFTVPLVVLVALAWSIITRGARYHTAVAVSREIVRPISRPDPWKHTLGGPGGPRYPIDGDDYGVAL